MPKHSPMLSRAPGRRFFTPHSEAPVLRRNGLLRSFGRSLMPYARKTSCCALIPSAPGSLISTWRQLALKRRLSTCSAQPVQQG